MKLLSLTAAAAALLEAAIPSQAVPRTWGNPALCQFNKAKPIAAHYQVVQDYNREDYIIRWSDGPVTRLNGVNEPYVEGVYADSLGGRWKISQEGGDKALGLRFTNVNNGNVIRCIFFP